MQRFFLKNKTRIAFISGALIILAFLSKLLARFVGGHELLFTWAFQGPMIVASVIGAIPIFIQAFQALRLKVVSIDLLVTIAVTGAFIIRNFEEAAVVTFLFLFGAYLEQRTLNKTRNAIKALTEMAPESALRRNEEGDFVEVDVDDVDVGDILLVKTGAKVPVDAEVVSGEGSVNEAGITGESIPVGKETGSGVYAGTILENGTLQIRAQRVGEDTTFGQIIELVEEAQDSKSAAERFIDRYSQLTTANSPLSAVRSPLSFPPSPSLQDVTSPHSFLKLEADRNRPIIYQFHLHIRCKDAAFHMQTSAFKPRNKHIEELGRFDWHGSIEKIWTPPT